MITRCSFIIVLDRYILLSRQVKFFKLYFHFNAYFNVININKIHLNQWFIVDYLLDQPEVIDICFVIEYHVFILDHEVISIIVTATLDFYYWHFRKFILFYMIWVFLNNAIDAGKIFQCQSLDKHPYLRNLYLSFKHILYLCFYGKTW